QGATLNNGAVTVENATLTLDDVTVKGATITETVSGSRIQVDGGHKLTLDTGTTIQGGIINDFTGVVSGTIDVIGNSTIGRNATLNKGVVTVESATLTLDDVIVNGTTITEETNTSLIQVKSGHKLTLQQGASINGGALSIAALGTVDLETS